MHVIGKESCELCISHIHGSSLPVTRAQIDRYSETLESQNHSVKLTLHLPAGSCSCHNYTNRMPQNLLPWAINHTAMMIVIKCPLQLSSTM